MMIVKVSNFVYSIIYVINLVSAKFMFFFTLTTATSLQSVWISIALVAVVIVLVSATIIVLGLCIIKRRYGSRVGRKADQNQAYELREISEEDGASHPPNASTPPLDVSNPLYPHHANKTATPVGIYSEVGTNVADARMSGSAETKVVNTQGTEFIGLYNVVNIIESTAYAAIESKDEQNKDSLDEAYAAPDALDRMPKIKPMRLTDAIDRSRQAALGTIEDEIGSGYSAIGPAQTDSREVAREPPPVAEEPIDHLRTYTDIQVREAPAVPTKSSDFELYLDTRTSFNVGTYSDSINPLDFTRDRKKGKNNDPTFLAPVHTFSSELSESGQDPAKVTSANLTEKVELGTGQFGAVVLADTNGLSLKKLKLSKTDDNQNISIVVAVKKLKPNPSQAQKEAFDRDVHFMSLLRHPNVLRLLGVCYQDPAFIMMEYMEEGDLNQFLRRYSEIVTTPSSEDQIAVAEILYMASQIASGMQYLAKLSFIHRDLATRSCYVGKNSSIKVGDLGVNTTLRIHQSNYYRVRGNRLLPIRWMATECFSGKFSEKSDVWAFGVTMWELFTLGKEAPYPHLSDEEVIHNALKREHRQFPSKPVACPDHVYEIMENCFIVDLAQRAMFKKLHAMLQTEL